MIVKTLSPDGIFYITSSDEGKMIRQLSTGNLYSEAWDLVAFPQEYEETEEDIDNVEEIIE